MSRPWHYSSRTEHEPRLRDIDQKAAYDGYFRITELTLRHALFAGGQTPTIVRECFERGHAVGVLPYDPWEDQVVLVEQFRVGALRAGFSPWVIETVAGIIEPGETPEAVAHRESQEEAGCRLGELVPISHYLVSPGGTSETVHLTARPLTVETFELTAMGLPMMPKISDCMCYRPMRPSR